MTRQMTCRAICTHEISHENIMHDTDAAWFSLLKWEWIEISDKLTQFNRVCSNSKSDNNNSKIIVLVIVI